MKKVLVHGVLSGGVASLAAVVYNKIYILTLGADFSKVLNMQAIAGINIVAGILASFGYYLFRKIKKRNTDVWFNAIFTVITFVSLLIPISVSLPLNIEYPELFMGLAIPMQLFPQLFWLTVKPLMRYYNNNDVTIN